MLFFPFVAGSPDSLGYPYIGTTTGNQTPRSVGATVGSLAVCISPTVTSGSGGAWTSRAGYIRYKVLVAADLDAPCGGVSGNGNTTVFCSFFQAASVSAAAAIKYSQTDPAVVTGFTKSAKHLGIIGYTELDYASSPMPTLNTATNDFFFNLINQNVYLSGGFTADGSAAPSGFYPSTLQFYVAPPRQPYVNGTNLTFTAGNTPTNAQRYNRCILYELLSA